MYALKPTIVVKNHNSENNRTNNTRCN
jgi:hypothetical protein